MLIQGYSLISSLCIQGVAVNRRRGRNLADGISSQRQIASGLGFVIPNLQRRHDSVGAILDLKGECLVSRYIAIVNAGDNLLDTDLANFSGIRNKHGDRIVLNRAFCIITVGHHKVVQAGGVLCHDIARAIGQAGDALGLAALKRHGAHALAIELNTAVGAGDRFVARVGQRDGDGIVLGRVGADRADDLLLDRQADLLLFVVEGNVLTAHARMVFIREGDILNILVRISIQQLAMENPLGSVAVIGHKSCFVDQLIVGDAGLELCIAVGVIRRDVDLYQIAGSIQNIARLVLAAVLVDPVIESTGLLEDQRHELDQALRAGLTGLGLLRLVEGGVGIVLPAVAGSGIIFIELLHHEGELHIGLLAIDGLGAVEGDVGRDQVAAMIRPHMALGAIVGLDLVADHGAVVVAAFTQNLSIWRDDMAKLRGVRRMYRGRRRIVVYDGKTVRILLVRNTVRRHLRACISLLEQQCRSIRFAIRIKSDHRTSCL